MLSYVIGYLLLGFVVISILYPPLDNYKDIYDLLEDECRRRIYAAGISFIIFVVSVTIWPTILVKSLK